jgi:hypothetical protein
MNQKFILLLFSFLYFLPTNYGQEMQESIEQMSLGQHNGITLSLPYDASFAENVWKDYLKTFKGKSKRVKKSDEVFTDDANIPYISNNTVDLYSYIKKDGDGSTLKLWMDLGGGFVDSQNFPDAYQGVRVLMQGFEKQLNIENIKIELKNEENRLKDLERDLSKLEKINEKHYKEIEDWKQKIAENEDLIKVNEKDQVDMKITIEAQKENIRQVEVKLAKAES